MLKMLTKNTQEIFEGDEYVDEYTNFDFGVDITGACKCPNPSRCVSNRVQVYVYPLNLN